MTPELRGLIAALRRSECDWSSFTQSEFELLTLCLQALIALLPSHLRSRFVLEKIRKGRRAEPFAEPSDALSDSEPLKRVWSTPDRRVLRSNSQPQTRIVVATLV
ncbi:Uncharacterized protein Rs2_29125 [Raphanus sativus]|nr:Uncharacterized protein Rs2_29125 [Raphanus sativus]